MPELVVQVHELFDRASEIPDVSDCYLVGIWNNEFPEGWPGDDDGPLWGVPYLARRFHPLSFAREAAEYEEGGREEWEESYRLDRGHVRLGFNTLGVDHPIHLRFRWGEGAPVVEGIKMLPHKPWPPNRLASQTHCKWCHTDIHMIEDCAIRRLRALTQALKDGEAPDAHVKAVDLWHPAPTPPPTYEEQRAQWDKEGDA